ncbi:MAG: FkbM family methyltransferase [Solirubrobacterales bacterium]|nr:FkbM family methyltransferase [Solirubrobacterales bacterium]
MRPSLEYVLPRLRSTVSAALLRVSIRIHPRNDSAPIGDLSYGGYCVPISLLNPDSIVYSIGVGEDIRFDLELIRRVGCTVHAMDPVPRAAEYVRGAAAHEPRFVFHQIAVWSRDEPLTFHAPRQHGYISHSAVNLFNTEAAFQAEGRALRSLMRSWGHDHIDLLKVSAEGAEFEIVETLLREGPVVPILCLEISLPSLSRVRRMLDRLDVAGYDVVSANLNRGGWTFTLVRGTSQ